MTCLFYLQARAAHHPFRRCRPASEVETVNQQAVVTGLSMRTPYGLPPGSWTEEKCLCLCSQREASPGQAPRAAISYPSP